MKSPIFLLESDVFKNDLIPFIDILKQRNISYQECKFGKPYECYIDEYSNDENIIFLGSYNFAKILKQKTNWKGLYCNFDKFNCLYYYPKLGDELLNEDYIMLPAGDLKRKLNLLDAEFFIRPATTHKIFNATIVKDFETIRKVLAIRADEQELIVVASKKNISKEWRAIIHNKKTIAISQYKEENEIVRIADVSNDVIEYCNKIANMNYNPDYIWILDVAETNGKLKVIETGPFSCCGLYAANPNPIIDALIN